MSERSGVAFLVNSLRFGGAERHTVELFNRLPADRWRLGLAYLKREEHLLPQVDTARGEVWCGDFRKGWDFAGLGRLADWLRSMRPDVLVCVNTYPLFYGHLARRLAGLEFRIAEVFHSTELPLRERWQMRLIYRYFFNRSDRVIYVCEAQRAYWGLRGIRRDRSVAIHNGVDADWFRDAYDIPTKVRLRQEFGFSPNDFIVGICAALRPEKQHHDLLAAVAGLKTIGLPAKCLIIGDGPMKTSIEAEAVRLGLERDVAITGFRSDVRPLIASCDCMALVSTHVETFSLAALEGMALGKPTVMSAIGGAAEQIQDGENGFLFPASNVEHLTEALRKLADPATRARMGKNARAVVEQRFRLGTMCEAYAAQFAALAAARICR